VSHERAYAQRGVWRAMRLTAPRAVEGDVDGGAVWAALRDGFRAVSTCSARFNPRICDNCH
jgi:hypothetical protein